MVFLLLGLVVIILMQIIDKVYKSSDYNNIMIDFLILVFCAVGVAISFYAVLYQL